MGGCGGGGGWHPPTFTRSVNFIPSRQNSILVLVKMMKYCSAYQKSLERLDDSRIITSHRVMTREPPSHRVTESWPSHESRSHRVMTRRVTESPSHRVTESPSQSPSHRVITCESPSHRVTESPSHRVTDSPSHRLASFTESPSHRVTESPSRVMTRESPITESPSHRVMTRVTESPTRWVESLNFWRVISDSMTRVLEFVTYEEPWLILGKKFQGRIYLNCFFNLMRKYLMATTRQHLETNVQNY